MRKNFLGATVAVALAVPSLSPAASFGDWFTGATDDGQLYAGVMNESGGFLMKGCRPSQGVCYWYLVTSTRCTNESAPALFSSSEGTAAIELSCDGAVSSAAAKQKMYRYKINNPDTMDLTLSSTKPLGIAVALEDGRFAVYRFSMNGAKRAVSVLMQGAVRLNESPSQGTRDSTL